MGTAASKDGQEMWGQRGRMGRAHGSGGAGSERPAATRQGQLSLTRAASGGHGTVGGDGVAAWGVRNRREVRSHVPGGLGATPAEITPGLHETSTDFISE